MQEPARVSALFYTLDLTTGKKNLPMKPPDVDSFLLGL